MGGTELQSTLFRKNLTKIVILMCAVLLMSFASILLNGTIFFVSDSSNQTTTDEYLDDLVTGQPELRRLNKKVTWVTRLSEIQKSNLARLTASQVEFGAGCESIQEYCVLVAEIGLSGFNLRFTADSPPQLPSGLPWFGGFVNPINGSVYDLLGRAYLYQGRVDEIVSLELND